MNGLGFTVVVFLALSGINGDLNIRVVSGLALKRSCPELDCPFHCIYGYNFDINGCKECSCVQDNSCMSIPMCSDECINGFQLNEFGCMTCDCIEPRANNLEEDIIDLIAKHNAQNDAGYVKKRSVDQSTVDFTVEEQPTAARIVDDSHSIKETSALTFSNVGAIAVVVGCSVAGLVGLVVAGFCWFRLQKNVRDTSEVEYPAYGITSNKEQQLGSPGDRKLAQSAQMYHYQHQKQQMLAMEKANNEMKPDGSEEDSEEENEEGDYTVYECPGLAPTGEMEVKNPLFSEETPVTPAPTSNVTVGDSSSQK